MTLSSPESTPRTVFTCTLPSYGWGDSGWAMTVTVPPRRTVAMSALSPSSLLVDGSTCPICRQGEPLLVLLEMQASWVTAPPTAPLPGYVCVVSKRHVVEPYQLRPIERQMWWEEVMLAAEAITELLRSPKMNYEIHGNTIPHLHTLTGCAANAIETGAPQSAHLAAAAERPYFHKAKLPAAC